MGASVSKPSVEYRELWHQECKVAKEVYAKAIEGLEQVRILNDQKLHFEEEWLSCYTVALTTWRQQKDKILLSQVGRLLAVQTERVCASRIYLVWNDKTGIHIVKLDEDVIRKCVEGTYVFDPLSFVTDEKTNKQANELSLSSDPSSSSSLAPSTFSCSSGSSSISTLPSSTTDHASIPDSPHVTTSVNTSSSLAAPLSRDLGTSLRTHFRVVEMDSLDCAAQAAQQGYSTVCLNMASATLPGGGWHTGLGTQEEDIFLRSAYSLSLHKDTPGFPLAEFAGCYSPDVLVFRANRKTGYAFLETPYKMNFIAVAAYNNATFCEVETSSGGVERRLSFKFAEGTEMKIRTILRIAAKQKHDCVVLGAFGCGSYGQPPRHVAQLFYRVLLEEFQGVFRSVIFAILDDHNGTGNLRSFQEVFNQ